MGNSKLRFIKWRSRLLNQKKKNLEKSGILDQLTRVLVGLYEEPEKPNNAIDFVKKYLGSPTDIDVEKLKLEYERMRDENLDYKNKSKNLKRNWRQLDQTVRACKKLY